MRIAAFACLAAAVLATAIVAGCTATGRVDPGSLALPANHGSAHLSVAASAEAAQPVVDSLRERIAQDLLAQRVFSKVATDASPTDVIIHVDIVGLNDWEPNDGPDLTQIDRRAEIRAAVEVVDAATGERVGHFSATGTAASSLFGGSTGQAVDTISQEIARFLASG